MPQLSTWAFYPQAELMFSQIWQSEVLSIVPEKRLPSKHPGLHPFPSKWQVSERKLVFKNLFLNFLKIGPPSKTHMWEQKWGHRTERGFGPGRSEEWQQLSHNQQDWTPSELSMWLLYSPAHCQELRSLSLTQITSYDWLPEATEPRKLRSRWAIITHCCQLWLCVLGLLEQHGPQGLRYTAAGRASPSDSLSFISLPQAKLSKYII